MAWRERPQDPKQHLDPAATAACARAQQPRKHLAVHAAELALKPHLQILRRHRRPLLLCLEHTHRSAMENHVHRPSRMGGRQSPIVRIGIIGLRAVPSQPTEREMTTRTRRKIDAALKAKIALEALTEQATVADLAQRIR